MIIRMESVSEQEPRRPHRWKRHDESMQQAFGAFDLLHHHTSNSNNIVMWETLLNHVEWDCFRTLILPVTLKTQSQHWAASYSFSEDEPLCQ